MEQALPQFIQFGRDVCNQLDAAERREWFLTNGLGGYASGTVAGTLTRRYHGLLVAPLKPPLGRVVVFSKADATLILEGEHYPLHSNRWAGGVVEPRSYPYLEAFHLDGRLPVWRYAIGDTRLEARIWMEAGANTTYLAWRLLSHPAQGEQPRLSVRLLVNARDHHGETRAQEFTPATRLSERELHVTLPQGANLRFKSRCGHFTADATWIECFDLSGERERGLPDIDNQVSVGKVEIPLHAGEWVGFVATLEKTSSEYLGEALRRRQHHDTGLLRMTKVKTSALTGAPAWIDQLVLAADGFLIQRQTPRGDTGLSVIAGYPWFADWGRDTFIALPGLTLSTLRWDDARRILESWGEYVDHGLLPNHFPEQGAPPEFNSADAALWYIEAWRAYIEASQDIAALRRNYPMLRSIVGSYGNGEADWISLDPEDALLRVGAEDTQLTWMDARVDGRPSTPRAGKPVELNALWYNALRSLEDFAGILDAEPEPLHVLAGRVRAGFRRFVRDDGEGLYDVLDGPSGHDARIRPNQILAVSLPHSPLEFTHQSSLVGVVERRLATPFGLRTLDPGDSAYKPRYEGGVRARDAAYHQGPAWTWLLAHYALAVHRVTGDIARAQAVLLPLREHLSDAGLGTVSELFDAEPPYTPRGAPSQAWSTACVLMAWCRLQRARKASTTGVTHE